MNSLVSAKGPSEISVSPPRTRTVVASSWSSARPSRRTPRPSISATHASMSMPPVASAGSTAGSKQTIIRYFTVASYCRSRVLPCAWPTNGNRPDRHPRTLAAMTTEAGPEVQAAVSAAFRAEWGQVVATLIGVTGDWDLAEECAQDAFTRALPAWQRDGVPARPGAWLTTTARNRAVDVLRRRANESAKLRQAALLQPAEPAGGDLPAAGQDDIGDDRLRLIFTCCPPPLPLEARVALTLRTLAGLTTAEIARALLVAEPTMAQRIVRARGKIRTAAIPYRVPPANLLPERTAGVLAVLYLLFNEG